MPHAVKPKTYNQVVKMYLKNLTLTNFKNYELAELEFSPKINCFVGNNGVGKTNIAVGILLKRFANGLAN